MAPRPKVHPAKMPSMRKLLRLDGKSKEKKDGSIQSRTPSAVSSRSALPAEEAEQSKQAQNEPSPPERTEKYGLLEVGGDMISGDRDASKTYYDVDIVAVHGLNGDAYSTWTHAQTEKLWLRDFLPSDLPGARIYSFGYPAEVAFNTATGKLDDWARALLEGLKAVRAGKEVCRLYDPSTAIANGKEKCSTRAIVFLCHSMGGLVVKQVSALKSRTAKRRS